MPSETTELNICLEMLNERYYGTCKDAQGRAAIRFGGELVHQWRSYTLRAEWQSCR